MRIREDLPILIAAAGLLLLPPVGAGAAATFEAGVGVGWMLPHDGELADLYGGRPSFHLAVAGWVGRPAVEIGLEVGYSRTTADLERPFFVSSAEAELRWIPVDLTARLPLLRGGSVRPYLGAGIELLWSRESFRYRFDDLEGRQQPAERVDAGFLLLAGLDRVLLPRLRLETYLSIVPSEHRVSVGGLDYPGGGNGRFDAGALGLRISWRLP